MYEVFNWGYSNDEPPKRFSLSIAGSEINIDGPANPHPPPTSKQTANAHRPTNLTTTTATSTTTAGHNNFNNNNSYRKGEGSSTLLSSSFSFLTLLVLTPFFVLP